VERRRQKSMKKCLENCLSQSFVPDEIKNFNENNYKDKEEAAKKYFN
jgi:hypothetical protein